MWILSFIIIYNYYTMTNLKSKRDNAPKMSCTPNDNNQIQTKIVKISLLCFWFKIVLLLKYMWVAIENLIKIDWKENTAI